MQTLNDVAAAKWSNASKATCVNAAAGSIHMMSVTNLQTCESLSIAHMLPFFCEDDF